MIPIAQHGGQGESGGQSGANGGEETKKKVDARFKGLAVFKGAKMVGEIDSNLTKGHLLLTNSLSKGTLIVNDVKEKSQNVTITLRQLRPPKIEVQLENNVPKFKIHVYVDALLDATTTITDYLDDKNKHDLNIQINNEISRIVREYLDKTVELNSDISGLRKIC